MAAVIEIMNCFRPLMGLWPLKSMKEKIAKLFLASFPSPDGVMAFKDGGNLNLFYS